MMWVNGRTAVWPGGTTPGVVWDPLLQRAMINFGINSQLAGCQRMFARGRTAPTRSHFRVLAHFSAACEGLGSHRTNDSPHRVFPAHKHFLRLKEETAPRSVPALLQPGSST